MELPEQDRQAFIDAARRRSQPQQGGAAFGVYPSSGKRPEKLNVSRDVNMPAQVARGWAAGLLGLPGDIESLGRLGLGLAGADVSETPVLPTSDFYREYLPGYDPAPAARAASGLGALAGGAGATRVAGAAVKGAKATGKALGPKAAEMAESYLKKSGLAPELIAYQGSPHKFAPEPDAPFGKFKAEKIGTGEGAQAYGQGHYLAESPEVAKGYRDRLSGSNYVNAATGELAESGKAWTDATKAVQDTGIDKVQHPDRAGSIASQIQDWVDSGKTARSFLLRHTVPKELEPAYEAAIDSFDLYRKNKGYLYTVDVPDEMIGKMLDWDKPLSQQPEALGPLLKEIENVGEVAAEKIRALAQQPGVADWAKRDLLRDAAQVAKSKSPAHVAGVLRRMQLDYGISPDSGAFQEVAPDFLSFVRGMQAVPNMDTGGGAVSFLQARYGDKQASEILRQAGIPGIKYLDQGSRGPSGSGRWNIKFPDGTEQIFNFKPGDDILKQMNATAEPVGTRNFVIFPGEEESVKIIDRKAEGGLVQDTDAIAAKLTGMDKDKALTHALRMANAKQEAHMQAGGLATLFKGAKAAKAAEEAAAAAKAAKVAKPVEKAAPVLPVAPRAQALEKARKNAIKAGQSPKEAERMLQQGYEPDWYHGTTGDIKALERERLGQATGAESAKKAFFFVRDPSTPPPEMLEKTRDPKSIDMMKKLGFSDEELAKLNEVSMKGHGAETASGYSQIGGSREYNEAMRKANAAERAGKWSEYEKWMQVAEDSEIGRMESAQDLVAKYGEARDVMLDRINNAVLNKPLPQQEAEALDAQMKQLMPYGWYNSYSIPQLKALKGEIVKLAGPEAAAPALQSIDDFISVKANRMLEETYQEGSNVMPVALRYKNPMYYDFGGSTYRDQSYSDLIDQARAGGHDALIIKNTFDPGAGPAKLVDIGAVFKPEQVRSRFAAFDPARINENDLLGAADPALLAGTAVASGIGLGALGQMSKPKPKQEEKKKAAGGLAKRM